MFSTKKNIFIATFLSILGFALQAQQYIVEGIVLDKATKERIFYADVYIKGTTIGTSSDDTGYFKIILDQYYDSIAVSFLGYNDNSQKLLKQTRQYISFELETASNELFETVIYANRESIEDFLLKKIQQYKPKNDLRSLQNYAYKTYSKVEIDIKNISEKTQGRKVLKPFAFIFNNIDSTSEEEPFLPMMIAETISDVYYSKSQNKLREEIIASKISGLEDESFSEFLGATATQYNIYDNSYNIMNKEFISPIAPNGKMFYEYKVIDTILLQNIIHYKMQFKPKGESSNTFFGSLIVSEHNFAIKQINLSMAKHVNINFIKRIELKQNYEFANQKFWMLSDDYIAVEFMPLEKKPSFIIRRNTTHKDFQIEESHIDAKVKSMKEDVVYNEDLKKDNAFWDSTRFTPLSKNEAAVYYMIDTLQSLKPYKTISYFMNLLINGYIKAGPVSFGPVFNAISYNQLEGWRFRLGMKTNDKLSKRFVFEGFGAYGLRDKDWKYGLSGDFLLMKYPRQVLSLSYIKDVSKLRRTQEVISTDNLLSQAILRNRNMKLLLAEEAKIRYNIEWKKGQSQSITFQNRRIHPKLVPFVYAKNDNEILNNQDIINTTEIILNTRVAFGEKFLFSNEIFRSSINRTSIPVLNFEYVIGIKDIFKSQYNYQKITLSFAHLIPIRPIGKLEIKLQTGKVFGKVPFILSEVHDGNQTFGYNSNAFNLMNDYEFYSDQYFQWILIHHFEGFFLNKIPGVRKLKLREYVDFRGVWGNANAANRIANSESGIKEIGKTPYLEIGFGLENVLKFFKLGAACRLTHRTPDAPKWSFLFGLDFDF
jgi:hypothetical protein